MDDLIYRETARRIIDSPRSKEQMLTVLRCTPPVQPERRWERLMKYLADLQLAYSPNWGANGCGDEKLHEFVTGLIDELQGWEEEK